MIYLLTMYIHIMETQPFMKCNSTYVHNTHPKNNARNVVHANILYKVSVVSDDIYLLRWYDGGYRSRRGRSRDDSHTSDGCILNFHLISQYL